ncbi:diacylglycerol/polyprenol kinase family protein [Pyrococcus yayanosii]|uniref:Phosphatidate cytidylyltransferase n=1 Tax=Pyrococcus yayanosii (strain CH1 / JCM 16557) TaxID=529709 RepID=F8AEE3_PYRYC|nr:membrane protein [Pyrococcus yayanosii]AEH25337.1 phosphatidate cytidylyltransferase [Pyrococcus yayanosii CH1]
MNTWLPYAIAAAAFIIAAICLTRHLGEEWAWVNRKLIHFSIVPAILMYYLGLIPKEVFSIAAFSFGVFQLWPHIRKREFSWYQIRHNYGEVFFAFSASAIVAFLPREYAVPLLLVMAISDGVTGIIRHYYFRRHGFNVKLKKHWTGSLGYLVTAILIAFLFLNGGTIIKVAWAGILMIAEYQPYLDDNLAVPLVGSLLFLAF